MTTTAMSLATTNVRLNFASNNSNFSALLFLLLLLRFRSPSGSTTTGRPFRGQQLLTQSWRPRNPANSPPSDDWSLVIEYKTALQRHLSYTTTRQAGFILVVMKFNSLSAYSGTAGLTIDQVAGQLLFSSIQHKHSAVGCTEGDGTACTYINR